MVTRAHRSLPRSRATGNTLAARQRRGEARASLTRRHIVGQQGRREPVLLECLFRLAVLLEEGSQVDREAPARNDGRLGDLRGGLPDLPDLVSAPARRQGDGAGPGLLSFLQTAACPYGRTESDPRRRVFGVE